MRSSYTFFTKTNTNTNTNTNTKTNNSNKRAPPPIASFHQLLLISVLLLLVVIPIPVQGFVGAAAFFVPTTTSRLSHGTTTISSTTSTQQNQGQIRGQARVVQLGVVVTTTTSTNDDEDEPSTTFPSIDGHDFNNVIVRGQDIISHVKMLDESLLKLTNRGLCERMEMIGYNNDDDDDDEQQIIYKNICRNKQYVLISHGTQKNPIYNYVNMAGLNAFHRTWDDFITIPSAQSVVLQTIDEERRIELMTNVTNTGFVEGATGVRVRGDDQFLRLVDAVVWNCYDDDGNYSGQAAFFDTEKCPILSSLDE